ncbi:MAG TPA: hypothetical protein VGB26_14075 [Nitrospiria bacterium]|jgi:hypothetical protein
MVAIGLLQSKVGAETQEVKSDLIYVSDYFSFVGKDVQGHLAFALD